MCLGHCCRKRTTFQCSLGDSESVLAPVRSPYGAKGLARSNLLLVQSFRPCREFWRFDTLRDGPNKGVESVKKSVQAFGALM